MTTSTIQRDNRKHVRIESIYVKHPHIQSRAAYVRLRRKLEKLDATENYRMNLGFRRKFLEERLNRDGVLICEYCGKRPLIIDRLSVSPMIRKELLATIDHVKPLSRGGSKFDKDNIKIACPQCNGAKRDMTLCEFAKCNKPVVLSSLS